jgi:photosystem II stability/assembly factor-like uncharacterized protein
MATGFNYTLNASNIPVANYTGYTGPSGGNYIFWTVNANTIQSGGPTGVNATLVKNNLNINGSVSGLSGTFSDLSIGTFATGYNSVNTKAGFTGSYGTTLNVAGSTLTSSLTFGDNSTTISGNLPIDYTTFGVTGWIQNTSVSNINCRGGICMSSSGQYQTVGTTLTVYVSSNYGQTWSSIPSILNIINYVCMSSSGQYQLACSINIIYYSTNYGQTWIPSSVPANVYYSSAISSSGQYQSAVVNNGTIYYSTNYGQTWVSSNAPTSGWLGIAMSSLGRYQTAVSNSGDGVWYSTDFGKTWLKSFSLPMTYVAMSASGQYQTISSGGGSFIYNSTNYGLNWDVSNAALSFYNSICMSSSGQYRMACVNGTVSGTAGVYYSIDYGLNWSQISLSILASNNWYSICMSSSGQFQSVCINNSSGSIYTNGLYSSPIYGNISFQGPSTNSITTSGTATLSINSQGGALTLQSAGTTYATVDSTGVISPSFNGLSGANDAIVNAPTSGQNVLMKVASTTISQLYSSGYNIKMPNCTNPPTQSGITTWNNSGFLNITQAGLGGTNAGAGLGFNATYGGHLICVQPSTGYKNMNYFADSHNFYVSDTTNVMTINSSTGVLIQPTGVPLASFSLNNLYIGSVGRINQGFNMQYQAIAYWYTLDNTKYFRQFNSGSTGSGMNMYFDNNQSTGVNYFSAEVSGAWSSSDYRIKVNISPIRPVLKDILKLNPVSYKLRNKDLSEPPSENPYDFNFIAQEVQKHIPELVSTIPSDLFPDNSNLYTLSGNMNAFLVKAIQEQNEMIVSQQNRITSLETQLASLKANVEALVAFISK